MPSDGLIWGWSLEGGELAHQPDRTRTDHDALPAQLAEEAGPAVGLGEWRASLEQREPVSGSPGSGLGRVCSPYVLSQRPATPQPFRILGPISSPSLIEKAPGKRPRTQNEVVPRGSPGVSFSLPALPPLKCNFKLQ